MSKQFKPDEYIIYQNGGRYEIGRVKRVTEDGAFVYYSSGTTAAKTPIECMHKLSNKYVIQNTSLGGASGPGWIPRGERLPEADGEYLASFKAESGDFVEICCFENGQWVAYFEDEKALVSNVVAWMPLPEPYEEDDDV